MSDETKKVLILLGMILYVISPMDCLPGPLDDIIVVIAGLIASRKLTSRNHNDLDE